MNTLAIPTYLHEGSNHRDCVFRDCNVVYLYDWVKKTKLNPSKIFFFNKSSFLEETIKGGELGSVFKP